VGAMPHPGWTSDVPSGLGDVVIRPLVGPGDPFGTSHLPALGLGVDLAVHGYREDEFEVVGHAVEWTYDDDFGRRARAEHPYLTRVLVRRPVDPARFSGSVQLEPLHTDLDRAPTWRLVHPWILRSGHAWVGVTQSALVAADTATHFPDRYGRLSLPVAGLGFDIVGAVARALKAGGFGFEAVDHITLSGWSITGSFSRVYLQEGFADDHRAVDGTRAVDAVLIGKTSGGLARAGYPPLSADTPELPADHPRRTVRGSVPTFEVLSESESETHGRVLRPDSDAPDDRYRLLQFAGTTHVELRPETVLTNAAQYGAVGGQLGDPRIVEEPSDARFELFGSAAYASLEAWARGRAVPPVAPRFEYRVGTDGRPDGLQRDADGTAVGGIRPPWLAVPTARYRPTSTPAPGAFPSLARFPGGGSPEHAAALIGHRLPFTADELAARYASDAEYRALVAAHCRALVNARSVLSEEADAYLAQLVGPGVGA